MRGALLATVVVTATAFGALSVLGRDEPPAYRQLRGYDVGAGWNTIPLPDAERDLREANALGAGAVRATLRWSWLAPQRSGAYRSDRVAKIDRLLEVARREGVGVVAQVASTPCWASSAPRPSTGGCDPQAVTFPPRDPTEFERFIAFLASRWGDRLAGLEVWNEPNEQFAWRGTPAQYVGLVKAAATAVRRSPHAGLPVVAGALSGADTDYLSSLYRLGVARSSDAISIHPYDLVDGSGFGNPTDARPDQEYSFAAGVPAIHRIMLANGDSDPLWLTEFGFADCAARPQCVSSDEQADRLDDAVRLAATWSYVEVALVFRLRDWLGAGPGWRYSLGVLGRDWAEKPAAEKLRNAFSELPETFGPATP